MPELDTRDFDRLTRSWDKLLKQFPEKKAEVLCRAGDEILARVQSRIGGTGKVKGWQAAHMGSKGGYVAVRAKKETYQETKSGERYAVGYITNAIEGGHRHGGPRGSSNPKYKYRPRNKTAAVPGKHFYQAARNELSGIGQNEVRELVQDIVDGLEGNL